MTGGTLTDVPGVLVGCAEVEGGGSGCTVVLGPFRGAVEVRGLATGTRDLGPLAPEHLVPEVDAVLLTGGSAYGLAAADGVSGWLAERGRGFQTGVAPVPIVPSAVLFDLVDGRPRPDAAVGRAACEAAGEGPVPSGRRGAGAGATVGKLLGPARSSAGGQGGASARFGPWTVGALAVVNALGDVHDAAGHVVAGVRAEAGGFAGAASVLAQVERSVAEALGGEGAGSEPDEAPDPLTGRNTTLAVVATDAPLDALDLVRLARVATTALARRIDPVHTPFDGDVVFALSTARHERRLEPRALLGLAVAARDALANAITAAVVESA